MIFLDFDGVIADLNPVWFRRFNALHGTDYRHQDVTDWEISLIPEEMKPSFYRVLNQPDLYDEVEPIPGALQTLAWLNTHEFEWTIASACTSDTMVLAKVDWLRRHGVAHGARGGWPYNFIPIHHKQLLRGQLLLDDGPHNLRHFQGLKLLFDAPYNRGPETAGLARIHNWRTFRDFVWALHHPVSRSA